MTGWTAGSRVPLVTVIIPAYNAADFVGEALESVVAQHFEHPFEIIVVNDGSPDTERLEAVLQPFRARIVYLVQEHAGVSSARNTGLFAARGRYVAMLDSDDRFHPEYLASQIAQLEADPRLDVIYPDAERFGEGHEGERYSDMFPVGGDITFSRVLRRECQIYGEITARTDVLRRVGGYDMDLRSAEDFDLWLRLLHSGANIAYNDRVLAYYRVWRGSLTADVRTLLESLIRVLEKVDELPDLTEQDRVAAARQRVSARDRLLLLRARQALLAGDGAAALCYLRATPSSGRLKIRAAILALQLVPSLAANTYRILVRINGKPAPRLSQQS